MRDQVKRPKKIGAFKGEQRALKATEPQDTIYFRLDGSLKAAFVADWEANKVVYPTFKKWCLAMIQLGREHAK